MPRLAIIIPFLGDCKALEDTLVSVLENRPDDCQILVVLGKPYEDPYHLDDEVELVAAPSRLGWIASTNLGIELSRAPIVHLLSCGTLVTEGWADAALRHFDSPSVVAVAPLVVDRHHPERILAAGMAYGAGGDVRTLAAAGRINGDGRLPPRVVAPHQAAAFYRKSALDLAGRFTPQVADPLAWLDMGLRFQQLGWRTVLEPQCRVAAESAGPCRPGRFRTALEAERFFWRWAGVHGWLRSLVLHGLLVLGESVCGLANLAVCSQLAGRILGGCRGIFQPGRPGRIHQARNPAPLQTAQVVPAGAHLRQGDRTSPLGRRSRLATASSKKPSG